MTIANRLVCLATAEQSQNENGHGGRCGSIRGLTPRDFGAKFGEPHDTDIDGKVNAIWYFMTPRGLTAVYDYWWNRDDELSIGLRNGDKDKPHGDSRAAMWLARYLREHGIYAFASEAHDPFFGSKFYDRI